MIHCSLKGLLFMRRDNTFCHWNWSWIDTIAMIKSSIKILLDTHLLACWCPIWMFDHHYLCASETNLKIFSFWCLLPECDGLLDLIGNLCSGLDQIHSWTAWDNSISKECGTKFLYNGCCKLLEWLQHLPCTAYLCLISSSTRASSFKERFIAPPSNCKHRPS